MDNPEECKICFESFNDSTRRPRTLPCGHTYCTPCIGGTIKDGHMSCPGCRACHPATHSTQFPINYGMEALVRKLKAVELTQAGMTLSPSAPPLPDTMEDAEDGPCPVLDLNISHDTWAKIQMQKRSLRSCIPAGQEVQFQLDLYRKELNDWKTQHLYLLETLYSLVEQNKAALELLEQEDSRVLSMKEEGKKGEKQLEAVLEGLNRLTTVSKINTMLEDAGRCNAEAKEWIQKCQKLFPDVSTVATSSKMREACKTALETVDVEAGVTESSIVVEDSASTIMQKVDRVVEDLSFNSTEITLEELRRMQQPIKRLVKTGQVFAVQENQSGARSSMITLENGQLYLHCLMDQPPLPNARTLPVSEVMASLDPSSTLVFLELSWPGSVSRVHIRLSPNTPLARQFILLCTGAREHSFRNTTFLEVCGFRRQGEFVMGGDYQYNDGSGGAPLLPDLQGDYRVSGRAGSVWSRWGTRDPRSAQFSITTRNCKGTIPRVFGMVENGLEVVQRAVSLGNIMEVTVTDCGVLLAGSTLNI